MTNITGSHDGHLRFGLKAERRKISWQSKTIRVKNATIHFATRSILCSASRPGIEGKTNEDSKKVQTEKLSLKAVPLANGMVKAKTGNTTDATTYTDWYKAV